MGAWQVATLTLENVALSYGGEYWGCLKLLNRIKSRGDKWSADGVGGARLLKAALERTALALQAHMDGIHHQLQPKAARLGKELKTDPAYLLNFGEEVVRGLPSFILSQLLAALDPMARNAGHMGAWEVVGAAEGVEGQVSVMEDMVAIQGKSFDTPQACTRPRSRTSFPSDCLLCAVYRLPSRLRRSTRTRPDYGQTRPAPPPPPTHRSLSLSLSGARGSGPDAYSRAHRSVSMRIAVSLFVRIAAAPSAPRVTGRHGRCSS
jgi:hypothetical protein